MTNRCPSGAYRGVGWTAGHAARETLIDDIARELGQDPIELRLRNLIPDKPFVSVTGMKYDGGSYAGAIRKVKEMVDYEALRARQVELRKEGRYLGIGWSPWVEPTAWGTEMAKANGFNSEFFDAASLTVEPDGSITVTTGCQTTGRRTTRRWRRSRPIRSARRSRACASSRTTRSGPSTGPARSPAA